MTTPAVSQTANSPLYSAAWHAWIAQLRTQPPHCHLRASLNARQAALAARTAPEPGAV